MNLHHYTSIEGIEGILGFDKKNPKLTLRATNVKYLNDSKELIDGVEFVKRYIKDREAEFNKIIKKGADSFIKDFDELKDFNFYIFSLSSHDDDLSQWRSYCPPIGGYQLQIDGSKLMAEINVINNENSMKHFIPKLNVAVCWYSNDDKLAWLDRIFKEVRNHALEGENSQNEMGEIAYVYFSAAAIAFKHECFVAEAEKRVVIGPQFFHSGQFGDTKYRIGHNKMYVPYVDIELPISCFSGVRVGPMSNQNLAVESLSHRVENWSSLFPIKRTRKNRPKIIPSMLPYRSTL